MSIFAKRPRASFADRLGNYPAENYFDDEQDDGEEEAAAAKHAAECAEAGWTPETFAAFLVKNKVAA